MDRPEAATDVQWDQACKVADPVCVIFFADGGRADGLRVYYRRAGQLRFRCVNSEGQVTTDRKSHI